MGRGTRNRTTRTTAGLLVLGLLLPAIAGAAVRMKWSPRRIGVCDPPNVFYSPAHRSGIRPCCPSVPGVCGGGLACPAGGTCPDGRTCQPGPAPARPNVVLVISDDQGECHYGHAGECRSVTSGTPIPAPSTPNLDLLAGYGTVFPVAHNTATWCFPSLATIVTGRYQKSMQGQGKPATVFGTIASSLRSLDGLASAPVDPWDSTNRIGGYCTFLGGKLAASIGENGFDARARTGERALGRIDCTASSPGAPPKCGSALRPTYDPAAIFRMGDVFQFLDALIYRVPGVSPPRLAMQNFFVWYAPRIPHQPLRAPQPIRDYLFGGGGSFPLGGIFNLGAICPGGSCSSVAALNESNFGDGHEMYGNLWWLDDGVREIREFLARESQPHCIGADGSSVFSAASPATCSGTWVNDFAFDLRRNTVIMMLSDNGWFLPNSKHQFTENGHRTRLIVYDPQPLATVPDWNPSAQPIPPARASQALAHAVDAYATIVGYALGSAPGTQLCPQAPDGTRCDGRDLRAHLASAPGGPAPPETLRHSLCGHETQRSTDPTIHRYLVTRAGSVGRCTVLSAPSCAGSANCAAGQYCLGGHCLSRQEPSCTATAQCPAGAACLGGVCRSGPSCLADADCTSLVGPGSACADKTRLWCRNDPGTSCTTAADCPACPDGGACKRLCEPRRLKFYVRPGTSDSGQLVSDLFLDPDEQQLYAGNAGGRTLISDISGLGGPYGTELRRAACCLDQWWFDPAMAPSLCVGVTCPADLVCNQ